MNIIQSISLSIIEGITEFLPISSTGHLILANQLLAIQQTDFVKTFDIAIQSGAILAVVVLYFHRVIKDIHIWKLIIAAFVPTGIIGFVLYQIIKRFLLGNPYIVLISLFIGGIAILVLEKLFQSSSRKTFTLKQLTWPQAVLIGLIQAISVIPGISRAAATIFGGLAIGLDRQSAVEFSFLLAIPTMLAATGYDLLKTSAQFHSQQFFILAIGFVGSFITALFVIKFLLQFIKQHNFIIFGYYRILLAIVWFLFLSL